MKKIESKIKASLDEFFEPEKYQLKEFNFDFDMFLETIEWLSVHKRNTKFVFTTENKDFLYKVWVWLFNKPNKEIDLRKGLFIKGNIGRGKSFIMELVSLLTQWYKNRVDKEFNKVIFYIDVKEIEQNFMIDKKLPDMNRKSINLYNDLGREGVLVEKKPSIEDKVLNHFGYKINLMLEIIEQEYVRKFTRKQIQSIVITNYPEEYHKLWYGVTMVSRFHEMYNFIELKGVDYRKVNNG